MSAPEKVGVVPDLAKTFEGMMNEDKRPQI